LQLLKVLSKLKFEFDLETEQEILRGKDFILFTEPFEFNLIFAQDGFGNYDEATKYLEKEGDLPLLNISGIIKSKKAAGRKRDMLPIDELEEFLVYIMSRKNKVFKATLAKSVKDRIRLGFIKTYKPVINDEPNCKTFTLLFFVSIIISISTLLCVL